MHKISTGKYRSSANVAVATANENIWPADELFRSRKNNISMNAHCTSSDRWSSRIDNRARNYRNDLLLSITSTPLSKHDIISSLVSRTLSLFTVWACHSDTSFFQKGVAFQIHYITKNANALMSAKQLKNRSLKKSIEFFLGCRTAQR